MRIHLLAVLVALPLAARLALAEDLAPEVPPEEFFPAEEATGPAGTPETGRTRAELTAEFYKDYEALDLRASVDNSRPSIGDWVTFRITAEGPEGVEFRRAELPGKLPDYMALKYRSAQDPVLKDGRVRRTWEFTLDFFFTGQFPLPPIVVTCNGADGKERKLMSPVFFVDIQDLPLDPENPADIRPNRAMAEIHVSYRNYYLIGGSVIGALVVLLVGAPMLIRWLRRPEELPPVPAHIVAYEQMRKLVEDRLPEQGRVEEYYVRLSDICRHYIENRFGLSAPERTTEEFLLIMAGTSYLREPHKRLVQDFLQHCDLVKFAQYGPATEEMEEAFASAKRLVDETRGAVEEEEEQPEPEELAETVA